MNTGDIILYRPSYRTMNIVEKAISWAIQKSTDGPFVHAEIIIDDQGLTIGATLQGIIHNKIPPDPAAYAICEVKAPDIEAQQHALRVVKEMLGQPYGWLDIMDVFFKDITANSPVKLALLAGNNFDCSDLCAYYLCLCGFDLPWKYPFIASPNDLGRFFNVR